MRIYYFNSDGKGFIWNPNFSGNYGTTGTYGMVDIHTVGSALYSDASSLGLGVGVLKETLVIQVKDPNSLTTGWIDNISMTQVYSPSGYDAKTITFSEDVNGWTSFKSFIPESGVSLSKKYFTMKDGGLWQHYVPMLDQVSGYAIEEANNYNTFYGYYHNSTIKAVLNNDPSTIKTFNTLNYEGSQAYIVNPSSFEHVTMHNAKAWNNGSDIDGWNCTEIKTDMDMGSVVEFIEKEGKWFNYIKGKTMNINKAPDTSRFSVQGIGVVSSVGSVTSY